MRSEMKEKAEHLLTQEKELKEKQKKLSKDQASSQLSLNMMMNSFNKTEAAVFSFRPCFLRATFLQFTLKGITQW